MSITRWTRPAVSRVGRYLGGMATGAIPYLLGRYYASGGGRASRRAPVTYNQVKRIARKQYLSMKEKLFFDAQITSAIVTSSGSITHLSAIPEGDGQSQRTGDLVRAQSLLIRMHIFCNASAANGNTLRVIVFRWFQDSTPVLTDILNSATIIANYNMNNKKHFAIMSDKFHYVALSTAGRSESSPITLLKTKPKYMWRLEYDDDPGTIPRYGGIYVLCISNEATNGPWVVANTRLRYFDS